MIFKDILTIEEITEIFFIDNIYKMPVYFFNNIMKFISSNTTVSSLLHKNKKKQYVCTLKLGDTKNSCIVNSIQKFEYFSFSITRNMK